MTLVELYQLKGVTYYSTDKFQHRYLYVYDELFKGLENEHISLFEIGYASGGSAKLFADFFKKGSVRCIEINPLLVYTWEAAAIKPRRLTVECKDATTIDEAYFKGLPGGMPDIVIDDGSHLQEHQLHTVKVVYPILKPGGMLIIEDIQDLTSFTAAINELGYPYEVYNLSPADRQTDDVLIVFKKNG